MYRRFGDMMPGCGGFVDITQNAKRLVFCGAFDAGGDVAIQDGRVKVRAHGKVSKFVPQLQQLTFNARAKVNRAEPIEYVTERAVFRRAANGGLVSPKSRPVSNQTRHRRPHTLRRSAVADGRSSRWTRHCSARPSAHQSIVDRRRCHSRSLSHRKRTEETHATSRMCFWSRVVIRDSGAPGRGTRGRIPTGRSDLSFPIPRVEARTSLARLVAQKLGELWGKSVVIDNRPGADTQIGNAAVATAAAGRLHPAHHRDHVHDAQAHGGQPSVRAGQATSCRSRRLPWYPYFLVVGNDVPVKNAQELIALAKKNPGKLNHAISSGGQFILAETMKRGAGIDVVGVRYKGGTPAVQATVTGEVTYHLDTSGSFKAMIDAKKAARARNNRRSPLAPRPRRPYVRRSRPGRRRDHLVDRARGAEGHAQAQSSSSSTHPFRKCLRSRT